MTSVTMARPVSSRASGQQLQALFLHALEAVGAGPRLERAAAEGGRAGRFHRAGRGEDLLFALDRAGPGDDADRAAADGQAADDDLRRLFLHLAAGDLVRGEDRHHFVDARAALERLLGAVALLADGGDDGPLGALNDVGLEAQALDPLGPCAGFARAVAPFSMTTIIENNSRKPVNLGGMAFMAVGHLSVVIGHVGTASN